MLATSSGPMVRWIVVIGTALLFVLVPATPAAADGLTVEVSAPDAAALGEDIPISVTVRRVDSNEPVGGATVVFYADKEFAGVSGEASVGSAITDENGVAGFLITVPVAGVQSFRAEVSVGGEVQSESILIPVPRGDQLHRSEVGVDLPGSGAWIVVIVVTLVWLIMQAAGRSVLAASRVRARDDKAGPPEEGPSGSRVSHLATVMMIISSLFALGIVVLLLRSPETQSNVNPEGYDRTPVAFLQAKYGYAGLGRAEGASEGAEVLTGRDLFLSSGCAGCHGVNAEGTASAPTPVWASADRVVQIVRAGAVGMPAYSADELSETDLDAIFVYLLEARESPIVRESGDTVDSGALPVTAGDEIPTFAANVAPILAARCGACHGSAGGWSAADYESVMTTGLNAPVIIPGDPEGSLFVQKILGVQEAGAMMPPSGTLPDAEIRTIIDWINAGASPGGDADEGAAIYTAQCAPCHGDNLEGGVGPQLIDLNLSLEEQMAIVAEGSGAMPAFGPTLTDEQLFGLELFLVSAAQGSTNQESAGRQVYEISCAGCHGSDLQGGIGPKLTDTPLTNAEVAGIVGDGAGTMQGFSDSLSPDDLSAVVDFVVGDQDGGTGSPAAPDGESAADLYASDCRTCHGAGGEGGAGPPLLNTSMTNEELVSVIADGAGSMPGFSDQYSIDEVAEVADYVLGLRAAEEPETPLTPDVVSGELIFDVDCSQCHGVFGEGATAPVLAGTPLTANEIVVDVWSGHPGMPAFHEVLTPDEILAVSSYVAGLDLAEGIAKAGEGTRVSRGTVALIVAVLAAFGMAIVAFGKRKRAKE